MRNPFRYGFLFGFAFLLILFEPSLIQTQISNNCSPILPNPLSRDDVQRSWFEDQQFQITAKRNDSSKSIFYTGDTININEETFSSLCRHIDEPRSDLSDIIIDARHIIIDAPLSFNQIKLTFRSKIIEFKSRALISVREPENSVIKIFSEHVVFDKSLRKPLAFFMKSSKQGTNPILTIATRYVRLAEQTLTLDQFKALIFRYCLDSIYLDANPNELALSISFGDDGYSQYLEDFKENSNWPIYFVAKLAATHAINPYDITTKEFLRDIFYEYKPYLQSWRNIEPFRAASRILELIEQNKDAMGWGPFFAPRRNITSQIKELEENVNEESEKYVDSLIALITAIDEDIESKRAKAREILQIKRDMIAVGMNDILRKLGSAITRTDDIEQKISVELNLVEQRHRQHVQTMKSLEQRGQDISWIKPIASVISVVALLAAQPEIAIPVATAANLTGEMIYKHNVGSEKTLLNLAEAINLALQQTNNLKSATDKTKEAWDKFNKSRQEMNDVYAGKEIKKKDGEKETKLTKNEASKEFLNKAGDLTSAIGSIYGYLKDKPYAFDIQLNSLEQNDGEIQTRLNNVSNLRLEQKEYFAKINELKDLINGNEAKLASLNEAIDELANGTIQNDYDLLRWKNVALGLWTDYFSSMYRKAVTLQRSYQLFTGKPLITKKNIEYIPAAMLTNEQLRAFDPLKEGANLDITLKEHLKREFERFNVLIKGILLAVKQGRNDYLSSRFSGTVANYRFQYSINHPTGSVEKRFMENVNMILNEAWKRARKQKAPYFPNDNARIIIPMMWDLNSTDLPEYFIAAEVARIYHNQANNDLGASIRFKIEHPGYGIFFRSGQCYPVDFRFSGATNTYESVTTMPPFNPAQTVFLPDSVRKDVEGENFYTYLPARTLYLLSISVTGTPKVSNVKITRMDIKIHYFK